VAALQKVIDDGEAGLGSSPKHGWERLGGKILKVSDLAGEALAAFKGASMGRGGTGGPGASLVTINGREVILIAMGNDGGDTYGNIGLYSPGGKLLASGYFGESNVLHW